MGPPPRNQNFVGGEIIKLGFKDFPLKEMDKVLEAGIDDLRFCKLIEWMCNEISTLYGLDETVHAPTGSENMEFFLLELSSLLAELECPVDALTSGSPLDRFRPMESRMKLLNFLIGHLKCARLTALDRLQNETTIHKSDEVCLLEKAMSALGINQVSAETASGKLFATLQNLAEKQMAKCKEKPNPLLTASLTEAQWAKVAALNEKLIQEYRSRILLLLKRLDVTIESFTWSDRIKKMQDKLHEIYRPRRDNILVASNVTMSDLLAATTSLLMVDKVDSEKERKRTATRLNKVLMTDRPGDRGGRPSELRAPPPEMPSWMKDRAPDMGRQRGGYQGGGGGGYGNYQGGGGGGGYGNYQSGGGGYGNYQGGGGGYGNYQSGGGGYGSYQGGGGGYGGYQSGGGGYGSYQGGGGGYGGYHGGGGFQGGGRGGGFENQVMREYEGRRIQDSGRGGGRGRGGGYGNQRAYR